MYRVINRWCNLLIFLDNSISSGLRLVLHHGMDWEFAENEHGVAHEFQRGSAVSLAWSQRYGAIGCIGNE